MTNNNIFRATKAASTVTNNNIFRSTAGTVTNNNIFRAAGPNGLMNTLSQAEMERRAVELNAILERYSH